MKQYFFLTLSFFLFTCSKKQPAPEISFSAVEIIEGSVNFKAMGLHATSYLWDFGDGYSTDVEAPSHFYAYNGTYVVKLTAKGKGGETTVSKDVIVKSILGEAMFWMRGKGEADISLSIDGSSYVSTIQSTFPSEPACASGGAVTFSKLFDGEHTYYAKEKSAVSPREWSGTVTVVGRKCVKKELVY